MTKQYYPAIPCKGRFDMRYSVDPSIFSLKCLTKEGSTVTTTTWAVIQQSVGPPVYTRRSLSKMTDPITKTTTVDGSTREKPGIWCRGRSSHPVGLRLLGRLLCSVAFF